jgi:hypothetical protein
MPDHKGFYQFYFVFIQMKNENIPFKEIVAKLKLVPADILGEWNRNFNTERSDIEPQYHLYVELSPVTDNAYHHQAYYFEETLDALRYELDELLYEKSSGMKDDSAGAEAETFLIMLEETNSFCHRYLDGITITPISTDGFWIGFTLRETTEKLIKRGKKAIKFYMKWVYTRKQQLDFSWN